MQPEHTQDKLSHTRWFVVNEASRSSKIETHVFTEVERSDSASIRHVSWIPPFTWPSAERLSRLFLGNPSAEFGSLQPTLISVSQRSQDWRSMKSINQFKCLCFALLWNTSGLGSAHSSCRTALVSPAAHTLQAVDLSRTRKLSLRTFKARADQHTELGKDVNRLACLSIQNCRGPPSVTKLEMVAAPATTQNFAIVDRP